jgi:hypothetical protein
VVDVTNLADVDAELRYGDDYSRLIWVQPREVCRVPLLCPCCTEIQSSAFHAATQRASHMMQMREIEALRRRLERHVAQYLEIRWRMPALGLDGLVPMGSLLSSVSFLRQLVIPALSLSARVNHRAIVSEDDVAVGIGELVPMEITLYCSLRCGRVATNFSQPTNYFTFSKFSAANRHSTVSGEISLRCHQDLQNGQPPVDKGENLVICGPSTLPFSLTPGDQPSGEGATAARFDARFTLLFRYEGVHKIRPEVRNLKVAQGSPAGEGGRHTGMSQNSNQTVIREEDIFIPVVSFNVVTKVSSSSFPSTSSA